MYVSVRCNTTDEVAASIIMIFCVWNLRVILAETNYGGSERPVCLGSKEVAFDRKENGFYETT